MKFTSIKIIFILYSFQTHKKQKIKFEIHINKNYFYSFLLKLIKNQKIYQKKNIKKNILSNKSPIILDLLKKIPPFLLILYIYSFTPKKKL